MTAAISRWNAWQRGLWVVLLMLALFTWLGLLLLVHHLKIGDEQIRPVVALGMSLRWSISAFAGVGIAFACAGLFGVRDGGYPAPRRLLQIAVVSSMLVAWLIWRTSLAFTAFPAP